jgi:2-oxo-3-hexenedioate decarboxylase
MTPEEGYARTRALHEQRLKDGWRRVGRKIGFTNRKIWPIYGVYEPIWGTVYDQTVLFSKEGFCPVPLAGLSQPRIEPEICFKLKSAPASADPEHLVSCIEWMAHSIEIVQCEQPGWKTTLAECTAQNGLHGKLIVGTPGPLADPAALPKVQVALRKEGREIDRGVGANVLDGPLLALSHLVKILTTDKLSAGEIISTGTLTDAHAVAPGENWSTELSGVSLQGLRIAFQ